MAQVRSDVGDRTARLVRKQMESKLNAPLTTSAGRLFDAMSALLGICCEAAYEGQAAICLQAAAEQYLPCVSSKRVDRVLRLLSPPAVSGRGDGCVLIDAAQMLNQAFCLKQKGTAIEEIAFDFHLWLALVVLEMCCRIRGQKGVNEVCLSGGVFQNRLLLSMVLDSLTESGFAVSVPRLLPPNDGGLSLGQAVVALARSGNISF